MHRQQALSILILTACLMFNRNTDLAGIVQRDSVGPSHHYFRGVFIHGTLAVSDIGDVLNHHLKSIHTHTNQSVSHIRCFLNSPFFWVPVTHTVVRLFSGPVQNGVWLDHVVHHVALGDLFGAELLRRRQVLPIIVAQVIVADDGGRLSRNRDYADILLIRKCAAL